MPREIGEHSVPWYIHNDPTWFDPTPAPVYNPPAPDPPPWGGYNYSHGTSYYGQQHAAAPAPAPPPDPWAGIAGAIRDGANSLTDNFAGLMGSEKMVQDSHEIALRLAKDYSYLLTQPSYAYEQLFNWAISDDQRLRNPWLRFGMKADDYYTTISKLNSIYNDWTGEQLGNGLQGSEIIHDVNHPLWEAMRRSWTPDQLKNYAMYGNASGGSELRAEAKYGGAMPWLSAGQSFSQTSQQYAQFEGYQAPSKEALADFWRFGSSLKNLGQSHTQQATTKLGFLEKKPGEVR